MPEISILRTEIDELNESVANWLGEIDLLTQQIEDAREEISIKTAEIERLEAEAARGDLITQLTEALSEMSTEQLAGLVSSLQSGETPTIQPVVTTTHGPTVTVEIPVPEQPNNPCYLTSDQFDELEWVPGDMREADITIAGVRHQDLFRINNYVPQIGEYVRLDKETETSNCFGVLIASEENGLEEDMAIGVLPTEGGAKEQEIRENDLPCRTHQSMWGSSDLDDLYEVTGVVIGRYVTIRKVESDVPISEEDVEVAEEQPSNNINMMNLDVMGVRASDEQHARRLFNERMPDHCTLTRIESVGNNFVAHYNNHRANTMEGMTQAIIIPKAE